MTTATAMIQPTASQLASAEAHLSRRELWRTVRINGTRYVVMASSTSGRTYTVRADARGCSCRWYEVHQTACSHMISVANAASIDALDEYLADVADQLLDEYEDYETDIELAFAGVAADAGARQSARKGYAALFPQEAD